MFKFLKDKLKKAVSKFSKKAEQEAVEEEIIEEKDIQLDEKTIQEEGKKLEEERKRKEEELKELEEKKLKEEEAKKKRGEEKRKKREEKKLKEEEERKRKEEERLRKEAEIKKLEEERLKKEEELKKAQEEEEIIKKEAEITLLKEEEKRKEEEEKKKRDKKKKLEEERRRKEEEEKKKREEKRKEEEEKKKREEKDIKRKQEELNQIEKEKKDIKEKQGFFAKIRDKLRKNKEIKKGEVIKGEEKELVLEEVIETEKKGFLAKVKEKVTTKKILPKQFDELFWELELALLENNVAVEVIEKIKEDLKKEIVDVPIKKSEIQSKIIEGLKKSIESLFEKSSIDLVEQVKYSEKPYVIIFVGINGSGKTTSIAKIAKMMLDKGLKPIMAASDTFRAAAIQQLEEHGKRLGVKVVKHDYGADPSAVAFDAIKAAKASKFDVVLIDTAGRMHSNINLIDELKKIVRVAKPDMKIFVGEAITGNDCVEQAKAFNNAIDIDGIILSKADIDDKGGAAVSVSYVIGKPIIYLGIGQGMADLKKFDKEDILKNLGF